MKRREKRAVRYLQLVVEGKLRGQFLRESSKLFGRDDDKVLALKTALRSPKLMRSEIGRLLAEQFGVRDESGLREFGDGVLLDKIIEFISSDEFAKFMETILKFIMALI